MRWPIRVDVAFAVKIPTHRHALTLAGDVQSNDIGEAHVGGDDDLIGKGGQSSYSDKACTSRQVECCVIFRTSAVPSLQPVWI